MSGWNWDELTGLLSTVPMLLVVPSRMWTDIASRLLEEMVVSDGLAWMQRFEALNRLLGHPVGQQAAIAACVSHVADPANQEFVEPVSVLDESAHVDAGRHVLRQLTHPINERTRYGALLACIRKVRYGHFTPEQMNVTGAGRDGDARRTRLQRRRGRPRAWRCCDRCPRRFAPSLDPRLRRALVDDRTLGAVLAAGRLAARVTSRVVVDRIVRAAEADLARTTPGFTDDLLPVLVDEILFAPVLDVRLFAAKLMRRDAVRRRRSPRPSRPSWRDRTWSADSHSGRCPCWADCAVFGDAEQRSLVERLVLASGLPGQVSTAAVASIAHVGGVSSDQFWPNGDRAARSSLAPAPGPVERGRAQGARLRPRHRPQSRTAPAGSATTRRRPDPVRAAASWWLDRPARVYASVRS